MCKIRGKFRTKGLRTTNPIAVGDHVEFTLQKNEGTGIITDIKDRKNVLLRKSTNLSRQSHIIAANIDYAVLIASLIKPVTYPMFIDRYLVACEANHIDAAVVFNKLDLYDDQMMNDLDRYVEMYETIGYKCFKISVKTNQNIDLFREFITGKTIVISGNSGVGKSSLINLLEPGLELKTSEISEYHEQGKHTTTFAEMHQIGKGYIIDTPGIKGFGLTGIDKTNLAELFPEMKQLKDQCKFNNCTHTHEPDCAVKHALKNNDLFPLRYENYLKILEDEEDKYRTEKY
jgi:ribosome biogenesis GTPase